MKPESKIILIAIQCLVSSSKPRGYKVTRVAGGISVIDKKTGEEYIIKIK